MSQTVFISYMPQDAARAAGIAALLRSRGIRVSGDLNLPDGAERADVMGPALADALIVLALWSQTSTVEAPGNHVVAEADAAKARGAHIGVLLDRVALPARFESPFPIDLVGWSGGEDKRSLQLIDTIIARLPEKPVPPPAIDAEEIAARRARKTKQIRLAAIAAVLLIVAAAVLVPLLNRKPVTPQDEVRSTLAAIPCAWLQVDPVDNGSNGKLVLTGVADKPEAAGERVRTLLAKQQRPMTVTTDRIARIASADCPAIDEPRKLRVDDGGRLRVTSEGVGVDQAMRLAEARVHLAFQPEDQAMALFGIEPSGKVTSVLPDFPTLEALANEDVGFTKQGRGYDFSLRSDHLGWTGLLLVTGSKPLATAMPQGSVMASQQFADFLRTATAGGDRKAEMVWYEITPR